MKRGLLWVTFLPIRNVLYWVFAKVSNTGHRCLRKQQQQKYKTAYFSLILELSSCYLSTVQHEITISVKSTQPSQNPQQYKKKNSFGQQQLNRQK